MDKENKNVKPSYYITKDGTELFSVLENNLLSDVEYMGALKFNIYKYVFRHNRKNGIEDLKKACLYIKQLINFEESRGLKDE